MGEAVEAEIGEMDFSVLADEALRSKDRRGVEKVLAEFLGVTDDRVSLGLPARGGDRLPFLAVGSDGMRERFLKALEAIAGQGALREDDEVCLGRNDLLSDSGGVVRNVSEAWLELGNG